MNLFSLTRVFKPTALVIRHSTTICKLVDLIPALHQSDCRIPNRVSAKTVHSSSTNCTARNPHTSGIDAGHVQYKNVSLQNKLQPVNFYTGYFLMSHSINFQNTKHPTTCHYKHDVWQGWRDRITFFAVHVVRASLSWRRLPNNSRIRRLFLMRNLENLSSRTWFQTLVIFTIAKYHCWFVIESSRSLR